jgi:hypothetical protein
MNLSKKVANRYARQNAVEIVETDEFFDTNSTHGLDVMVGGERKGYIEGEIHFVPLERLDQFECAEDIRVLYDLWHDSLPRGEWARGLPIFEVLHSSLDADCRDKKIGLAMYKKLANLVREEVGKVIFFIPNYCNDATTSIAARRVWKSLTKSNRTSEGDVILMVGYELR